MKYTIHLIWTQVDKTVVVADPVPVETLVERARVLLRESELLGTSQNVNTSLYPVESTDTVTYLRAPDCVENFSQEWMNWYREPVEHTCATMADYFTVNHVGQPDIMVTSGCLPLADYLIETHVALDDIGGIPTCDTFKEYTYKTRLNKERKLKKLKIQTLVDDNKPFLNYAKNCYSAKIDDLTVLDPENVVKPPFTFTALNTMRPKTFTDKFIEFVTRRPGGRQAINAGRCDLDLVYRLKMYAALQPRTMCLANSLKMRAIRMIDEYNLKDLDSAFIYDLVMYSVAEAMVIDQAELDLRKRIKQDARVQVEMQPFLTNGQVTEGGAFSPSLSFAQRT